MGISGDIYLTFSDSAKFADVARNFVLGRGWGTSFSFWSSSILTFIKNNIFAASSTPPIMPYSIAVFLF